MGKKLRALGEKAHPLFMLVVGLFFIPLGIFRYPAFIVVGILYIYIGTRGLLDKGSDKTQLKRL